MAPVDGLFMPINWPARQAGFSRELGGACLLAAAYSGRLIALTSGRRVVGSLHELGSALSAPTRHSKESPMNSRLELRVSILFFSSVLLFGLAPSAKADAVYTMINPSLGFSWSFSVPALITTDTNITTFVSTNVDPSSVFALSGCSAIGSVDVVNPQSNLPNVTTNFAEGCAAIIYFNSPIDRFGSFGRTLVISPSGAPEPPSLLLLAGGWASLMGLRRKKLR